MPPNGIHTQDPSSATAVTAAAFSTGAGSEYEELGAGGIGDRGEAAGAAGPGRLAVTAAARWAAEAVSAALGPLLRPDRQPGGSDGEIVGGNGEVPDQVDAGSTSSFTTTSTVGTAVEDYVSREVIHRFFQNATGSMPDLEGSLRALVTAAGGSGVGGTGKSVDDVSGATWTGWEGLGRGWNNLTVTPEDLFTSTSASAAFFNASDGGAGIDDGTTESAGSLAAAVIAGIALSVICIMTIGGNVLVLLAVFVNSHLRSTTNYFIVNLAIADLLLGTAVLPFSASLEVVHFWAFGQVFCDIWAAVDVLCCTASIMSLCVISIDRYIGVTRPLQHSTIMSERRAVYIIVLVWALAIAISVAPLLGWKDPPPEDPTVCQVTMQLGYVLFSVSGSFYIPLTIILVVYFRVYREALTQSRFLSTGIKVSRTNAQANAQVTLRIHTGRAPTTCATPGQPPQPGATKSNAYQSSSSSEHSEGSGKKSHSKLSMAGRVAKFKREKKAAKTLGIVVGVFILCWFPFFFILPLEALCSSCNIPEWLFKIMFWLGYCNSLMNPIIYACSSREFKRAFTRILTCRWRRKPRSFMEILSPVAPAASATEMSGLSRLASVRRLTFRSTRKREAPRRAYSVGGAGRRFLLQATNGRPRVERESPIASLRLLHDQQRLDSVSSRHAAANAGDSTDDERSEGSADDNGGGCGTGGIMGAIREAEIDEGTFVDLTTDGHCRADDDEQGGFPLSDGLLPATEHHVTTRGAAARRPKFRADPRGGALPDIIVDEAEMEPLTVGGSDRSTNYFRRQERGCIGAASIGAGNRGMDGGYTPEENPPQSDNIMWL